MERLTIQFDGNYVPADMCTTTPGGEVDDLDGCIDYCEMIDQNCHVCAIQRCLNRLGKYESIHERIVQRIKEEKEREDFLPSTHIAYLVQELEFAFGLVCGNPAEKLVHTIKIIYRDGREEVRSVDDFGVKDECLWTYAKFGGRSERRYIPLNMVAEYTEVKNEG